MSRLRASIVVIGDEILGGFVDDTNSGWLARRLQHVGVPLDRVVTVPDDIEAIGEALAGELARPRPRLLLTSGGIGSTPDDMTMLAVAECLGMGLRTDPDLEARIGRALEWTSRQGVAVSAAHERSMLKMALVPEAAHRLGGETGFAPGVAVDVDGGISSDGGATVVILPGIPSELQRITLEGVEPELLAGRGEPQSVEELRHGYPESILNPVFDRLVADFPDVHLGSYPGKVCTVRLKGRAERVAPAMALVRAYVADLDADPAHAALRESWAARWA